MDSVAGEYAVDPTSLVIALPRTEAPTVIDTPPVPDEKPMTTETIVAPELVPDPRIDDLIALVTGLGASLSTIAQEVEALKTAPPAETTEEEPTEDPLVTASLQEALGLQKVALEVGVPSEDLVSPEGRATIVGAIETAVGLTDSWDPTGLSIQQRTLVCQTIHRMATKQAPKEPVLPTTIQDSVKSPRQTHPVVLPEVTVPRTTPTLLIR
jgi:hypothetical protein